METGVNGTATAVERARNILREMIGGFGAIRIEAGTELKMNEWAVLMQATEMGKELQWMIVSLALRAESVMKNGCVTRVRRGVYRARECSAKEGDKQLQTAEQTVADEEASEARKPKWDEWGGSEMPCTKRIAKCFQGEQCYHAERCEAARAGGFKTMEELSRPEGNVRVVWSWGGVSGMGRGRNG